MQVRGKASGTVAPLGTSDTLPAQDPRMTIKESHSTSARRGDPPHYWKYHGAKSGGVHGAGEKGGVHALVNDKGDYIDLKGNNINPLNPGNQAKDQVGRMFTVIRDINRKIVGVSYGPGQNLDVIHDASDGTLKYGSGKEVIAKIDKPQLALIKQEASNAKNMTEYIGSVVFRSRHPDLFPEVHLVRNGKNKAGTGDDIYAASIYIENYTCDLYKDIHNRNNLPVPDKKPTLFGMTEETQEQIRKAFIKEDGNFRKYENFAKVTVPALRGDEFDMHTGNIGLKGDNQLVRIDLAGAWRKICKHPTLRPNSNSEHPVGFGPSNRFAQYDDSLKLNAAFVDELDNDVNHDYDKTIRSALSDLTKFYDADAFKELAKWVGIKSSALPRTGDRTFLANFIADKVIEAYAERGKDMSRYSAQLKLDLCLKKTDMGGWKFGSYHDIKGKKVSFKDVVTTHQDYFREVVCGTEQFKFRDAAHAGNKNLTEGVRIEVLRMFAGEIVGNVALKANLESLTKFSGQKITTADSAFQALKECNLSQVRLVLGGVSLK
jgi:hypothetical protein